MWSLIVGVISVVDNSGVQYLVLMLACKETGVLLCG